MLGMDTTTQRDVLKLPQEVGNIGEWRDILCCCRRDTHLANFGRYLAWTCRPQPSVVALERKLSHGEGHSAELFWQPRLGWQKRDWKVLPVRPRVPPKGGC